MHNLGPKVLLVTCLSFPSALLAQNWFSQTPSGSPPPALDGSAMVYDPVHHQSVLFGGADTGGTVYNRTYVYNGTTWTQLSPATSPGARLWHGMAFDAASGTVILFGGCADTGCATYLGDTWSWNGTTWTNVTPNPINSSNSPGRRRGVAMTYLGGSEGGVLLFGGSINGTALADTWIWIGNQWEQLDTSPVPAREFASLTYDPIAQNAVLFGGQSGSTLEQDTWLWYGDWDAAAPEQFPSPRSGQGQVYDPTRQMIVLFGGNYQNDTWLWSGISQSWSPETTTTLPTGRDCPGIAYDIQHAQVVMYGGQSFTLPSTYTSLSDTWILGYQYTAGWMGLSAASFGSPLGRANMASGSDGTNIYMFGGIDFGNTIHSDFWTWNGDEYSYSSPVSGPSAREYAALSYSPDDNGMILFGGGSGAGGATPVIDTTWKYTGAWTQVTQQGQVPGPLIGPSLVYDSVDDQQILFGGYNNGLNGQTWAFSSDTWSLVDTVGAPQGRWLAAMVYDNTRSQTVLFGGEGANSGVIKNDTWVLAGNTWTEIVPAHTPPGRYSASMVYDSVHGTVLLFGGQGASGPLNDVWQWDGVDWTEITAVAPFQARYGAAAAFDSGTQQTLLFGGYSGSGPQPLLSDTWLYASPFVGSTTLPIAFYQQNYSNSINPLGGFLSGASYTFGQTGSPSTFNAGTNGLTLSATGQVTGTDDLTPEPTPLTVGVTVADSQGQSTVIPITVFSDAAIVFNPSPPSVATAGTTYSYSLSSAASGGTPPFRYAITSGPAWLSVTGSTISGSCPASTSSNVTLEAIDSLDGFATAGPFTINCNPAPQITNTSPLAPGQLLLNYHVQLGTNADYSPPGASPYTWSITVGALPQGLGIGATTGAITGAPTATGTATFTVTFTDVWGATTSQQFQITVLPQLLISTTQLALGNLNIPYPANQAFAAIGGAGGYTFNATNLPTGLQLNSATGAITGTPTAIGSYTVMLTVTDQASNQYQAPIPIYVVIAGSDPVDWVQLNPSTVPGGRTQPAMFYDPDTSTTVMFGGGRSVGQSFTSLNDTWSWDGTTWTALANAGTPGALQAAAVAYDPVHHQGVLFGGYNHLSGVNNLTWLWNGSTWSQPNPLPTNSPSARSDAVMFWDGQQIVLFGGNNGAASLNDTWVWNGTDWSQPPNVTSQNSPSTRQDATAVYDSGHNQAVLFGGLDRVSQNLLVDTWIWNGTAWSKPPNVSYVNSPGARAYAGMAYDSVHGQSVLYGGFVSAGGGADYSDTWAWNGSSWTQIPAPYSPSYRDSFGMAYDAAHGQSVFFGGDDPNISQYNLRDTWVFTGPVANTALPAGYVGTPYNDTISVQGGIPPDTYVLSGNLPPGMSFTAATQTFGGTPTQNGTFGIPITVQDSQGIAIVPVYTVTVSLPTTPLVLSPTTLPDATAGANYSVQLSATGGVTPYAFSAQNLPNGLSLNGNNQIVGQCTSGSTTAMLQVTDGVDNSSSAGPLTVNCNPAPSITSTSPLPNGVAGFAYTTTLQMTGGTPAITWSLGANNLPHGFQLSNAGVLTGASSTANTYSLTVSLTDRWGATANATFNLTFNPPLSLTTTTLPNATAGANYSVQLAATGGLPNYIFTVQNLPAGLSLNSGNQIAGQCTGSSTIVAIQVTDSINEVSSVSGLTVTCNAAPSITTTSPLPSGVVNVAYTTTLQMSGGTPAIAWALGANNLPNGFLLSGAGVLTGTSSTASTYTLSVSVSDRWGATVNRTFTLTFNSTLSLTTTSLPNATAGTNYSVQLGASGGLPNYTFTVQNLPAGLSLNGSNQIVGLCTGNSATVGLKVTDSINEISTAGPLTVTCNAAPAITTASPLPGGVINVAYTTTLQMTGGTPAITWALGANNLPNGFLLSNAGVLTGAASASNTYSLTVSVTDIWGATASQNYTLTFNNALTLTSNTLPNATAGTNYSVQLTAAGGVPNYTFTVQNLPAGLSLNGSNQIVGKCTGSSTTVGLKVTDSISETSSVNNLTVTCNAAPAITNTSPLTSGVVGVAYTATLQMTGGTPIIAWSLGANNLPNGFLLSNAGVLTGTASSANTYSLTATVTDFWGATANQNFTLTFYPVLSITTASLPGGTAGTAYQNGVSIAPNGGTGAGTYQFTATGLPTGFSIDLNSGAISGTTMQTGAFTPTFKLTDQDLQVATKQLNLVIASGSGIAIDSPTVLPTGTTGQLYRYQLTWTGGVPTTSIASSALPAWLSLNPSTGLLSGTPTAGGAFTFPVTVTDSQSPNPNTASQNETIVVNPPSIEASPLPPATIGIAYSQNLTASGGAGGYSWTAFNLPAWLSVSNAGALTGTPPVNTPASIAFNVTVTDSLGAYTSGSLTLPVQGTPALFFQTASPLPPAIPNAAYSTSVQGGGGNSVYSFSANGEPKWVSLNSSGSQTTVSGIPPVAGPVTFQITLSDNVNQSLTQYFTIPVNSTLVFGTPSTLPPATVQQPYSQTLAASGGNGSYTWSATGLPAWLALSAQGVLGGTPPQAASVSFRVTVKDTANNSLSQTFNLQAVSVLTINTATPLAPATLNFPYYATFAASGGGTNYQWSATGLPGGFTLSSAGVLLGTAQAVNPIAFTAKVTDSLQNTATLNVTLPVNANIAINTASPLATATQLIPFSANLTASGGVPGYTWTASGLPAWLNLSQAGYLSGTPPAAGAVSFQATVTDSQNNTTNAQITVPVNPSLSITSASPLTAILNSAYSATLTASGGVGPYTWSAPGLPQGLTLSPNGQLNGTFTQIASYTFQVTVYDTETSVATKSLTLLASTGVPLSFVTQSLNPCIANNFCTNQIVATGGNPPYTFSLGPNANLGGLTLFGNGVLSGTPTAGGSITVPVIVTDQQSSASHTYNLTVIANISVTNTTMPNGTVGQVYGVALTATGGNGGYTWSIAGGTLPPGLNFDTLSGEVYGTPTLTGSYTFSVQATDGQQTSPPRQLTITIAVAPPPPLPLTITSAEQLPPGSIGTPYSQSLSANGGSGTYSWTLTGGALPAGLSLANTGAITGTPTGAQSASFTATVNDTSGNSAATGFTVLVINPNTVSLVTPNPLPNGAVGVLYQYVIQVLGGSPPYSYAITAGQLPPGIVFDSISGTFIGTPTVKGTFGIVLTVTDSGGTGGQKTLGGKAEPRAATSTNYTIQIAGPGDFQVTTQTLPADTLGQVYSITVAAAGGVAPYKWQLLNGNLPKGLTLTTAGVITGIPTVSGTSQLVIQATDSTGAIATEALLLQVANPTAPAINALPPLPPGITGVAYQGGLTAIGGKTPYTWSISGGSLPPGLSLNPQTGALTGTPAKAGQFPFVAQVTDANRVNATQSFTILINSANLTIAPAAVPAGTVNVPYTFGLSVTGGTAPYTWSLNAGGLPPGFNLNPSTGVISGTPTAAGAYQFTVSVADSNYGLSTQNYTYTVQANPITLLPPSAPAATVGVPYSLGFSAQYGNAPLTFAVASGTLPPGIQLAAGSSTLTGTPTTAGTYTFTVQVTDATSATSSIAYTLVVNPAKLSIVTASLPSGAAGTAYSQTLKSSGGNGTISWSLASGSLPTGLSLSSAGAIAGTPTIAGSFSFTVAATDSTGVSVQQPLSLTIAAPPAVPTITLSGLPATSNPGAQPTVTITLASAYPLPIQVTATLSILPNPANATDLMFQNGSRTTQLTIPAGATTAALPFQVGTLPGAIQLTLSLSAAGVNITPAAAPTATTTIAGSAPVISNVTVTTTASGLQVTVVGTSTTLNMTNANFTFTPAAGSTLQTSTFTINVSALFSAWYASAASFPTGSQFSLTVPFTIGGNVSSIASVSVTLTNSAGTSAAASANVP